MVHTALIKQPGILHTLPARPFMPLPRQFSETMRLNDQLDQRSGEMTEYQPHAQEVFQPQAQVTALRGVVER